jgi:hypothetical protein
MGWKSCGACCGDSGDVKNDGEKVPEEMTEEVDEQFVFLEQFPTDRRVENPVSSTHHNCGLGINMLVACFTRGNQSIPLVAGLPPQWPWFESELGHMGFVVDKVALE